MSRLALAALIGAGTVSASAGEITFPEEGACYGWGSVPVAVEDTFDPALPRTYLPQLPPPRPQQVRLTAPDMRERGNFGESVALAGDLLLVGATGGTGSVHEFRRAEGIWTHVRQVGLGGLFKRTSFGIAVATDGEHALVGAVNPEIVGRNFGAVFAYRIGDNGWEAVPFEAPEDLAPGDFFGSALGLEGDVLCVGASGADDFGESSGAAYVYRFDGSGWRLEQRLLGEDLGWGSTFGIDCAVEAGTLFVGANDRIRDSDRGRVYVFEREDGSWSRRQVLETGLYRDYFGSSVDADADVLAVGAPAAGGTDRGAVHVFERDGGQWIAAAVFSYDEPGVFGALGTSVAIDGSKIVAGSVNEDLVPYANSNEGLAHTLERSSTGWERTDRWAAFDAAENGFFGDGVAIEGDTIVVGSRLTQDKGRNTGSVYIQAGEPIAGYYDHGDITVWLGAGVPGMWIGFDSVGFTIDLRLPTIDLTREAGNFVAPVVMPAADLFVSADEDGASGGVVHESLLWGKCPIFDGDVYGDGDGLLSDETLVLDEATVCAAVRRCGGLPQDRRLRVEARDCAGNVGSDTRAGAWNPVLGSGLTFRHSCERLD